MPIFDIFKKKRKEEKPAEKKKEEILTQPVKQPAFKPEKEKEKKKESVKEKKTIRQRKRVNNPYRFLKSAHITEKATSLSKLNQYLFKVPARANKIEIRKAVADIYNVDVLGVNIVNVPDRERRLGRTKGVKRGYKKAIVKIKEGQKIELLPR